MANPLKGEVGFVSGADRYTLVYTIDALIALEEAYGKTVGELGEMLGDDLRMADLRRVFHAGLAEHHPDVDEKSAGRIMSEIGVTEAGSLVGRAFAAAFGGGEAGQDGGARPPEAGTGATASTSGSSTASAQKTSSAA
jgi:hypothetical protein